MSGNSPDSPDPRTEFEGQWGTRRARKIRGGAAAKRKKEAWIRYQSEQTGVDPSQVPVVHSGGQSRPLYTTSHWEPESAQSDCEVEVIAEQIIAPETDVQGAFSLTAPVTRESTGSQREYP